MGHTNGICTLTSPNEQPLRHMTFKQQQGDILLIPQLLQGNDISVVFVFDEGGIALLYKFHEVFNELTNYFILGDICLLKSWQNDNGLKDDLASEFTTNESGDNAVQDGIILPMTGIANYPYTIIFNLSGDKPELLKEESRLQVRRGGYSLKVENNAIMLFTWPVLEEFTNEVIQMRFDQKSPMIQAENGWYRVDVLGGETLQDSCYEPTFEFALVKTEKQETEGADIYYNFEIHSSEY